MAVRGKLDTKAGELKWEVVQYKMGHRDKPYTRGATPDKLDSFGSDWVTIRVVNPDNGEEIFTTLWGPYLSMDVIEGELEAAFDTDAYLEAIG